MRGQIRIRILDVLESESMLGRMKRGTRLDLLYLHKRFAEKYGETAQSLAENLADINERGENLIVSEYFLMAKNKKKVSSIRICSSLFSLFVNFPLQLWRDAKATWLAISICSSIALACLCASPAFLWKSILAIFGLVYFFLQPTLRIAREKHGVKPSSTSFDQNFSNFQS